jgi:hypothetical protein
MFSIAFFAAAQGNPNNPDNRGFYHKSVDDHAPDRFIEMGADSMHRADSFPAHPMRLRGNVTLKTKDMLVKADELDVTESGWAQLRGNVQVKILVPPYGPRHYAPRD